MAHKTTSASTLPPGAGSRAAPSEGRTVIVGLGKTGLSSARFLARRGVPVLVTDSRLQPPGLHELQQELPEVPVSLGGFNNEALLRADQILISPGVWLREPAVAAAVARGTPVIGDIELFARYARAPVIAITGANGKSTVTTLVGAMAARAGLDVRVGGNLGTPALDLLKDIEPDLYVLELSSFQLETTRSLDAAAGVVLNISPDHMDRYSDLSDYARAKQRVYRGHGVMVINRDDPLVNAMSKDAQVSRGQDVQERPMTEPDRRQLGFTLDSPHGDDFGLVEHDGEVWLSHGARHLIAVREVRIQGSHNIANALAALALGHAMGIPLAAMLDTLREFPGLPHRSQWVAEQNGVRWVNDSKGTNVGATIAALQGLAATLGDGRIVLIAGGEGKDADFTVLRAPVYAHARAVVLIGRDASLIESALKDCAFISRATDMKDAVKQAARLTQPGDAVLLSPACASFDMYSGYAERGQVFMDEVAGYLESGRRD
ncbi:MAG TPA: UDP-N-acetylmuramoyl-L-alanine--D-glutamate ligase [Gammaproteobacteria bacterium]|nr:UDP-N-acetylmuramoyl-L-alanine--D-glutamate ligase [Gammaproteobacteria bacterium]